MDIKELELTENVMDTLIALSVDWEAEKSCHGYRKNTPEDIRGNRIFAAVENGEIIGYLFGHKELTDKDTSVYRKGEPFFELEELYVKPAFRNSGIGAKLFRFMEEQVRGEVNLILLGTATKNYKAILHFYIDEVGMEFWSAALFKRLS